MTIKNVVIASSMPGSFILDNFHYDDVIMGAMASQITSLTIVYSIVYSGTDQRRHQSSASLAFVIHRRPVPAQMASNAENVFIWWRHHVTDRRQAIIWTNAGILLIGPLGTNLGELLIEINALSFKENAFENVVWKMAATLSRPQSVKKRS